MAVSQRKLKESKKGRKIPIKKREVIKAMYEAGDSFSVIAEALGIGIGTAHKIVHEDSGNIVPELVKSIKKGAIARNEILGLKADQALSGYLDDVLSGKIDKPQVIPIVAIKDRTFQQTALLEGRATDNVSISGIVQHHEAMASSLQKEIDALGVGGGSEGSEGED